MHDKRGKQIIKALEYEGVYIVERITNGLNEFILLSAMQRDALLAFPAIYSLINLDGLINLDYPAPYTNIIYYKNEAEVNYG